MNKLSVFAGLIGQRMGQEPGQPIVVDHRAGAGATSVSRAAPGGYPLRLTSPGRER